MRGLFPVIAWQKSSGEGIFSDTLYSYSQLHSHRFPVKPVNQITGVITYGRNNAL